MYDDRLIGTHFNQPTILTGRFAGAGAAAPTPVTGVKDSQAVRTTITRNTTGNLVVQFLDTPLGILQSYDFWVCSNNQADRNVRVTPPTAGAPYTFQLNVTFMGNAAAADVAAGEELHFFVCAARTQVP
jgi:hypothetical protein